MKVHSLLFGFQRESLAGIVSEIYRSFGAKVELRESSFYGGEYFRAIFPSGEEARIYRNIDGDEPAEPDHANCHVLLQVDHVADLDMWSAFALAQEGVLIRRDSCDA